MPTLNDVLAGSLAQAVQVQQIIDAMKGTPSKGVPVAFVSLNDPSNYALSVQNDDPTNSRALSVLSASGSTLILADATGVTLGAPLNLQVSSVSGTALQNASVTNAKLASDTARLNLLTNGGFEIWQRGNGPFATTGIYTADRWLTGLIGTDTLSVSKNTAQCDVGSLGAAGCTFGLGSGAGATYLTQVFRTSDGYQLAGKPFSVSVRVRTSTASAVRVGILTDGTGGTTTYSSFHSGGGSYETLTVANLTPPTDATFLALRVFFAASCTAYLDNAMLVVGAQAADYAPPHPADDLARCLRYYEIVGESTTSIAYSAYASAGGLIQSPLRYVRKAVTPTGTLVGTWVVNNCAQPTLGGNGFDASYLQSNVTALGMAQFYNGNAGNKLTFEANP